MVAKDDIATTSASMLIATEKQGEHIDKTKYVPGNDEEFFANGYNDVYYEDVDFSRSELKNKSVTLFDVLYDFFTGAKKTKL